MTENHPNRRETREMQERADALSRLWSIKARGRTHRAPTDGLSYTPCCGLLPEQLPEDEKITSNPERVNCG